MTGPHRVSFDDVISLRSWVRSGRSVRKPASLKDQQRVARLACPVWFRGWAVPKRPPHPHGSFWLLKNGTKTSILSVLFFSDGHRGIRTNAF